MSIGVEMTEFLAGLRAGRSEVRPISAFDTAGFEYANGCEVTGFEPKRWIERLDPEHLGRAAQFTVAAATEMAATDAGLRQDTLAGRRASIAVGTTDRETDRPRPAGRADGGAGRDGPGDRTPGLGLPLATSPSPAEFALTDVEAVTIQSRVRRRQLRDRLRPGRDPFGEVDLAFCGGGDADAGNIAGFYRLGTIAPSSASPST